MADLKATLLSFYRQLFGMHTKIRMRPHFFPFTEPSAEVDVSCFFCEGSGCRICKHAGWLEMGGSGMVDPSVLSGVNYDPKSIQAMLRTGNRPHCHAEIRAGQHPTARGE